MKIKKFKNGKFSFKLDPDELKFGSNSILEVICNDIGFDFVPGCDGFGMWCQGSNCMEAETLYNCNTQLFYTINNNDVLRLRDKKTVKMHGYEDNESYKELVELEIL